MHVGEAPNPIKIGMRSLPASCASFAFVFRTSEFISVYPPVLRLREGLYAPSRHRIVVETRIYESRQSLEFDQNRGLEFDYDGR